MDAALFTSKSNEHYTPVEIVAHVLEFYDGIIDLDPCSNCLNAPNIPALFHYTLEMDGLKLPWAGKVFVNPPYGNELLAWTEKAITEYQSLRAREILLLVPSRTDTKWFHSLNSYPRLYFKGRLKFINEGNKSGAPFPSALFYLGDRPTEFQRHWQQWGNVELGSAKVSAASFDKRAYQREYMRQKRARLKAERECK